MTDDSGARRLIAYSFLEVFANDRLIDQAELRFLEKLALEDGRVDDEEREVLRNIFSRVEGKTLPPHVGAEIDAFRKKYDI